MSRLSSEARELAEPGPECVCGAELREIPLPEDIAVACGLEAILVHVESGDTRCYPGEDDKCTAEPLEASQAAKKGQTG